MPVRLGPDIAYRLLTSGSAGAAAAGAATGAGAFTTGAGDSLGNTADRGAEGSEGRHLPPGGLVAFGTIGLLAGLT